MKQYFSVLANRRPLNFMGMRSLSLPFLALVLTFAAAATQAQTSNEFFSSSYSGAIPSGPTAASQTARLTLNNNNPAGDTVGATSVNVSVTASLSNQQFTGFSTGTGNPVVMFGANSGTTGGPSGVAVFGAMSGIGGPANNQFSNTPSGTAQGLNTTVNHGFDLFTSVRHWESGSPPATNSRVYMADLTLTFSSPVTNPRIHIWGMGGTFGSLGFGSEFTLITPGLTLTKIQGNAEFVVTSTQINNGSASIGASCATADSASCGTVMVNGSNITTITFQVYVRGDGGGASWSGTTTHPGDRWMFAVSLPESYTLSGNVFNDTDGPGTINGTGLGSPGGTQLYANLIDPTDNSVIGSVAVNPDGTFSFPGVPGTGVNYQVQISTIQGTVFSPAPVRVLPSGWFTVGENLGSGAGNDGTADRNLSVTVGTATPASANFGITSSPTAADVSISGRVTTADGRGIRNVTVSLVQGDGTVMTANTSAFGYYSFDNIEAGQSVIVMVRSKRFSFANPTMLVSAQDNITDMNFVANQ